MAKATQPAAERYWVTSAIAGNYLRVGPAADPYLLLDESQVQNWAARSPKDGSPDFAKQLGAAPVSAADRAAWQRDGSPTSWNYVGQSDGLADAQGYTSGLLRSLSMAGNSMTSLDASYGAQQFPIGGKSLTLAQLQALPADPAALKKLILGGGVAPGESPSAFLLDGVVAPILEMPVTPAVRAALYEMLAAMPGIQSLGEVTDPAGPAGRGGLLHREVPELRPDQYPDRQRLRQRRVPILVLHHPGDPHHRPRHRTAAGVGTALRGAAPRPAVDRPRPAVLLRDLRLVPLDQRQPALGRRAVGRAAGRAEPESGGLHRDLHRRRRHRAGEHRHPGRDRQPGRARDRGLPDRERRVTPPGEGRAPSRLTRPSPRRPGRRPGPR